MILADPNKQAKSFWVNYNRYFLNKHNKADTNIMLSENGELIMKNQDVANTLTIALYQLLKI